MAKTTYADAMKALATKRAKYEKRLADAHRTNDRFSMNSNQRALNKVTQMEELLFTQQQQASQGKQMDSRGNLPKAMFGGFGSYGNFSGGSSGDTEESVPPEEESWLSKTWDKASPALKKYGPYAAQFGSDIYGLAQLNRLQKPVNAPYQDPTLINTDLDYSAAKTGIKDSSRAFNRNVKNNLTNSASAANLMLANKSKTDKAYANISMDEYNRENQLRNQQSALLTQNRNINKSITAQNEQRLVDFGNMKKQASVGIVNNMTEKLAGITRDFKKEKLDSEQLEMLSKQYNRQVNDTLNNDLDFSMLDPEFVEYIESNGYVQGQKVSLEQSKKWIDEFYNKKNKE